MENNELATSFVQYTKPLKKDLSWYETEKMKNMETEKRTKYTK